MKKYTHFLRILFPSFALLFFANTHVHADPLRRLPPMDHFPTISREGSALFTYSNLSGLRDDQIFVQVIGVNPNTGNQCFIQYDRKGSPRYIDVKEKIDSQRYAYSLTNFPNPEEKNERK